MTGGRTFAEVTLERTACYGSCPIYKIVVKGDGTVTYDGERFVKLTGHHAGTLPPERLAELAAAFDKAGYFRFEDAYTAYNVTDHPSAVTSYKDAARSKRIDHYHGDRSAPRELTALEDEIDRVVGTDRWIGTEKEREALTARGWPAR